MDLHTDMSFFAFCVFYITTGKIPCSMMFIFIIIKRIILIVRNADFFIVYCNLLWEVLLVIN